MMLVEVFVIKVDVEIVRFGVQYDGCEKTSSGMCGGIPSTEVERKLIYLVR